MDELRLANCNQVSSKQFVNLAGFLENFYAILGWRTAFRCWIGSDQ
jgi:hypothetical protein